VRTSVQERETLFWRSWGRTPVAELTRSVNPGLATGAVRVTRPSWSSILVNARAGGEATLLKLEGAGHGFTGNGSNKYAQETLAAALEFFTKHLMKQKGRL